MEKRELARRHVARQTYDPGMLFSMAIGGVPAREAMSGLMGRSSSRADFAVFDERFEGTDLGRISGMVGAVGAAAFLTFESNPGNHQASVAVSELETPEEAKDFSRRLRKWASAYHSCLCSYACRGHTSTFAGATQRRFSSSNSHAG
jgi:hypothetical protein